MTSAGVEKVQHVRDRNTRFVKGFPYSKYRNLINWYFYSVPLKKTNWDPYNGTPPPPPPPRSNVNTKPKPQAAFLPPPSRTGSASSSALSRANSSSSAPPLPSRSNSSATPPPQSMRTPSAPSPALPARSFGSQPSPPSVPRGQPPPIIQRSTRPDGKGKESPLLPPPTRHAEPAIDWANLSPEDKEVFFSWLDEFFARSK